MKPERVTVTSFFGIRGFVEQFQKQVPAEHWTRDEMGATVNCSCGHELALPLGLTSCRCERFFLLTEESLRVARYTD